MKHDNRVLHSACHVDGANDEVCAASPLQASGLAKAHKGRNPNNFTRPRGTPGLLKRKGIWHIDKVLFGKRICESTHTSDLSEAQTLLAERVSQARKVHLYGEPREYTFRQAGVKFLAENQHKRSLERDRRALKALDPFIGSLPLKRVHQGTLEPYIRFQRKKGNCSGTINREIAAVKRILNLASRYWRNEADQPWMPSAPMLPRLRHLHQRESYPLSIAEQRLLFSELKGHLKTMALFKVNTGLRQAEVAGLRQPLVPRDGCETSLHFAIHPSLELYAVAHRERHLYQRAAGRLSCI
jgi:hypothetical protein